MKSKFHLTAWQRFRSCNARWLSIRATERSKFVRIASLPIWLPLRVIGIVLQWGAWACVHVGEFLRTGHWYYVTWHERGEHIEFTADPDMGDTYIPPVLFHGRIQRVTDGPDKETTTTKESRHAG